MVVVGSAEKSDIDNDIDSDCEPVRGNDALSKPSNSSVHLLVRDRCARPEPVSTQAGDVERVEDLPFIVRPGRTAAWEGESYRLGTEGRYCFTGAGGMRNVLVFEEDYVSLFFALSQIHIKGLRHVPLSIEERVEVARCGRLSVMCGGIASVSLKLLQDLGHRARRILMLNPETGTNHVLFEYFADDLSRWILVDIHNHLLLESGGQLLGINGLRAAVWKEETLEVRRLSKMGAVDYFSWGEDGTKEFSLGSELIIYDDGSVPSSYGSTEKAWGIWDSEEELCYFPEGSSGRAERICAIRPNYRCLAPDDWEGRFYGGADPLRRRNC